MAQTETPSTCAFFSCKVDNCVGADQLAVPSPDRTGEDGTTPLCVASPLSQGHLVGLLQKSLHTIKKERARFAALQQELHDLRQPAADSFSLLNLQKENQELKKQLFLLRGQAKKEKGQTLSKRDSLHCVNCSDTLSLGRCVTGGSSTSVAANVMRSGSYVDAHQKKKQTILQNRPQSSLLKEKSVGRASAKLLRSQLDMPPPEKKIQPAQGQFFQEEKKLQRLSRDLASYSPHTECVGRDTAPLSREEYVVGMITKLRRAMAPQPSKEQLGEVIHAMVVEVLRDARRRGFDLSLRRKAPCVYLCEYSGAHVKKGRRTVSRVLHLSIDSGRLSVKVGGGHENFLEYLERYCSISIF